jgi:hypothetical protein
MEIHQHAEMTFIGKKEFLHLALFKALFQLSTLTTKDSFALKCQLIPGKNLGC